MRVIVPMTVKITAKKKRRAIRKKKAINRDPSIECTEESEDSMASQKGETASKNAKML